MGYLLLGMLCLGLFGLCLYLYFKCDELNKKCLLKEDELSGCNTKLVELEKYARIPNAIEKAKRVEQDTAAKIHAAELNASGIVSAAQNESRRILEAAEQSKSVIESAATEIIDEAKKEATELLSSTRKEAKIKNDEAESILKSAIIEATDIRKKAELRAQEISRSAYEAREQCDKLSAIAEAMRNTIDGYSDRYMVPTPSILDEWAQEYGFNIAGEKLRLARERVRLMEATRTAATCDYVEAKRREIAINFVLDAFNGKVDAILAKVKHDNYGKLRQQMIDAFHLVNFNGSPFKSARITDDYLEARLHELRCAEVIQQLRLREREEQRAIREQLREEQKAQREFERAIKQAQRDEELLNQSLERVRKEYESASVAEKAKYETRLKELTEKLKEAEERNQRALSMAQQTRCGHVYVISNIGSFGEDVYKIGLTRRLDPEDRIRELGDASVPFPFDIHAMIYSEV